MGELLVFNTDESPYLSTTCKVPTYAPKVAAIQNKSLLEDAPSSIMKRDVLKREVDEYLYAPGMGMVSYHASCDHFLLPLYKYLTVIILLGARTGNASRSTTLAGHSGRCTVLDHQ